MNKLLVVISLTAFLCCGVQSSDLSKRQLRQKIINSGIAIFTDFLDKVKNVTEKIARDEQFKKSRIAVQVHLKELSDTVKKMNVIDKEKVIKDLYLRLEYYWLSYSAGFTYGKIREILENVFSPFLNVYHETLTTKSMAGILREVQADYLEGAPSIHNKPMGFLSYLLGKAVVKSGMVNALKGGVNIALEVGKIDLNQLHEEMQLLMSHVGEKAAEISSVERRKEKNDFLVSLRTASGVIVFYWDQLLEHSESSSFNEKYLNSKKRWVELTELRNSSEKYHVLINPETRCEFLNWTDKTFGESIDAMALKYYAYGNEAFGHDRFNQSNWAILKFSTVYVLPIYEKLTESSFGISELNRLIHRMNDAIVIMEGGNLHRSRKTFAERYIHYFLESITVQIKEDEGIDDEALLPMRAIKRQVLDVWDFLLWIFRQEPYDISKYQQSENDWNHMRTIFINELIKSGEFTEEQLEEARMNFINGTRATLEKVMKFADMGEGFDERIDASIKSIKVLMHDIYTELFEMWDNMVE